MIPINNIIKNSWWFLKMVKKQKNFRIEDDLIQKVKMKAVELKTTESELVTRYIEDGLKKDENQSRLDVE